MSENIDIQVLIMAAGASRRMDGIKQLLPWKSSNFLVEAIKTIQINTVSRIHVVLGANAEMITTACNLGQKEVEVLVNPNWEAGLGNSIGFGVKKLLKQKQVPDGILICLADQPLITAGYINTVINTFKKEALKKIIATKYRNRSGVPALFPASFYPTLVHLQGDQGAREVLENKKNAIVVLDANGQLTDIDTNEEYHQLLKLNTFKNGK